MGSTITSWLPYHLPSQTQRSISSIAERKLNSRTSMHTHKHTLHTKTKAKDKIEERAMQRMKTGVVIKCAQPSGTENSGLRSSAGLGLKQNAHEDRD